jgi:hypothetical protein
MFSSKRKNVKNLILQKSFTFFLAVFYKYITSRDANL